MQIDGFYILGFVIVALSAGAFIFCLLHELTWFRRRGWKMTTGIVVGYHGDGKDGSVKYPVIEYRGPAGSKTFTSKYGGGKPPLLGDKVKVAYHPSMSQQEHFTVSNRILFTALTFGLGLLLLILGLAIIAKRKSVLEQFNDPATARVSNPGDTPLRPEQSL